MSFGTHYAIHPNVNIFIHYNHKPNSKKLLHLNILYMFWYML